ncbi:MAG: hypothetical protein QM535_21905 [Limnohabitans sp.]|nr:hypothetical protein [Limnohabitans sp.]
MRILSIFWKIFVFIFLTVLTQVGGLVYLFSFVTHKALNKRIGNKYFRGLSKLTSFLIIYSIVTFGLVPLIAKPFGRVPLPIFKTNNLQPQNILTCFLNRNYVRLTLRETAFEVANQMNEKYPNTTLNYLDANFPFINRFPLFPHLSHNDGKKLDISFCYIDTKTEEQTNDCPSFIGYGISEEPRPGEKNTTEFCESNGHWQYSLLRKIIPQGNKNNFMFDGMRTKELVNLFASQSAIGKIFIEPHLKTRLGLTTEKIRFHGCQAVRHDDHIHVQLY